MVPWGAALVLVESPATSVATVAGAAVLDAKPVANLFVVLRAVAAVNLPVEWAVAVSPLAEWAVADAANHPVVSASVDVASRLAESGVGDAVNLVDRFAILAV